MNIGYPDSGPIVDQNGNPTKTGQAFFADVADWINSNAQAGPTLKRPKVLLSIGQTYFDTSLGARGKPIWLAQVKPAVIWVTADGVVA